MIETRIASLAAIQILAVLLGHAAGVAGTKLYEGVCPPPAITSFYAHHGLWLLMLPILWFGAFMINQRLSNGRVPVWAWVAIGITIITGLTVYGAAAILCPMIGGTPVLRL